MNVHYLKQLSTNKITINHLNYTYLTDLLWANADLLCLVTRGWRKDEHRMIPLFHTDDNHPTAKLLDVWCKSKSFWIKLLAQKTRADEKPKIWKSLHRSDCSSPSTAAIFSCDPLRSSELLISQKTKGKKLKSILHPTLIPAHPFSPLSPTGRHIFACWPSNHQCPPTFFLLLSDSEI